MDERSSVATKTSRLSAVPSRAGEILDFWFGQEGDPEYGQFRNEWFRKDPAFDDRVTQQFADLYERAAAGDLDGWRDDAESCLALVIVLDQFPRNMFRRDGRTHAEDGRALEASKYAASTRWTGNFPPSRGCSCTCPSCTARAWRTSAAL